MLEYRVISIGTLSRNRLWGEPQAKRTAHATTTLIRSDDVTLLVDPSLPAEILAQRLDERAGLGLGQIDAVFLTTFMPVHRRALPALDKATWLMNGPEIEAARGHLDSLVERIEDEPGSEATEQDDGVMEMIRQERAMLRRIQAADDEIAAQVHLFPAAAMTPSAAGLLLAFPGWTTILAGDAVITRDYFEAGQVFDRVADIEKAQSAFRDILEVADEIIPGHGNVFRVPGR